MGTIAFGRMATGQWVKDGGKWYHVAGDGVMDVGLKQIADGGNDDGWYYFNPTHNGTGGAILSGWQTIDGERYYFNPKHDGAFGRAYTGTHVIDGKEYTFGADGKLVTA